MRPAGAASVREDDVGAVDCRRSPEPLFRSGIAARPLAPAKSGNGAGGTGRLNRAGRGAGDAGTLSGLAGVGGPVGRGGAVPHSGERFAGAEPTVFGIAGWPG